MRRLLGTSLAFAAASLAAQSLDDVCTVDNVKAAIPAADVLEGITPLLDTIVAESVTGYNVTGTSELFDFCNITFSYSHDGLNDTNVLYFWAPEPSQFKGRWLSTGGGGFSIHGTAPSSGLIYGAATGMTDGGLGFNTQLNSVILKANGTLNYEALYMFGYKAIHEMTLVGKAFTKAFYNTSKIYSYYDGCSEGGREGWSQVQRYGDQFDGASIGAPAFRMAFQQVLHLFSAMVENRHDYAPLPCELEKINTDTIAACDHLDGRVDGVVSRTDLCMKYHNANASIGNHYSCAASSGSTGMGARKRQAPGGGGATPAQNGTVTAEAAAIANEIVAGLFDSKGRRLYPSFRISSTFSDADTTYNSTSGKWEVPTVVNNIGSEWVKNFLQEVNSTTMSLDGLTVDDLRSYILEGMQKYADTLQTVWPDLEDFRDAGGKVIHYHGESDFSIPAASSVYYHEAVRKTMYGTLSYSESQKKLGEFYRFFLVSGAGHCGVSTDQPNGPFPTNVIASVIDWVEHGVVPVRLNATVANGTVADVDQQLCAWPLRPLWTRKGTVMECVYDQASIDSWTPLLNSVPPNMFT